MDRSYNGNWNPQVMEDINQIIGQINSLHEYLTSTVLEHLESGLGPRLCYICAALRA